jgi:hypothetical protein
VLAGIQALNGEWLVKFVRHDDAHSIKLLALSEHLFYRIVGIRNVPFFRSTGSSIWRGISYGYDLGSSLTKTCCVILQHSAGSNNSYFD